MLSTRLIVRCLGIVLIIGTLISCSGSTALVRSSDVDIKRRSFTLTPFAVGNIEVVSDVDSFSSNSERDTYEQSLRKILNRANLFGKDSSKAYTLKVTIADFNIPQSSFGGFDSTLSVDYQMLDSDGKQVFSGTIDSSGSDDTGAFLGPARQNRSRTVAVAENIQLFVEAITNTLEQQTGIVAAPPVNSSYQPAPGANGLRPTNKIAAATVADVKLKSLPRGNLEYGNYHALIIGNNAYTRITPLESATKDARRLAEILTSEYRFRTTLLLDASRDAIISHLTQYRRTLGPQDNLLIFYAGHGWLDEAADEGYWLPIDADADDPARWLSNSTLTTSIRTIKAKHILVIADSCFSGKLTRGANINVRGQDYVSRLVAKKARTVMTSGGLEPVVDSGGEDGHSVFASALFHALETNTGVLDTSLMFNVIRREVALNADQFPEYGDIRKAGHAGGDFIFVRR